MRIFNKAFTAHCDTHKVGTQMRACVIRCLLQKLSDLGEAFWQASRTFSTVYYVHLSTPVAIQLSCLISNFAMIPCYGMKVHKHFGLQILPINSSEIRNRTIANCSKSSNTLKGTIMQSGYNLYISLKERVKLNGILMFNAP